jgi:hypothetical protein
VGGVLAGFLAAPLFAQPATQGTNEPDIEVDPTSKDYGNVHLNSFASQTFVVTNIGNETLDVGSAAIVGGAGHFNIFSGGGGFTLDPLETRNVVVRFAPTTGGPKNATLRFVSNDPIDDTLNVALTGTGVIADISVSPAPYDYEDVRLNTTASQTLIVSNEGTGDLVVNTNGTSITGANANQFSIVNGGAPFIVVAGDTHHVEIDFTPTTLGLKTATLQIISNDPDSSVYEVAISGTGVEPNIAVNPGAYNYGNVQVDYSAQKAFYIKNTGTDELYINDFGFFGPDSLDFSIQEEEFGKPRVQEYLYLVSPGDSLEVVVEFTPSTEDPKSGILRVFSDDPDQPELDVALTGNGVIPDITVDPASWDYDSVAVNTYEDKLFVIGNDGSGDLVVEQMYISIGLNIANRVSSVSEFEIISGGTVPFTVQPGDTHHVVVRFQPFMEGSKFSTLWIFSNDPDIEIENPFSVELYGEGILEPEIRVEPPSGDFGEVVLSDDSTQAFWVYNDGSANLVVNTLGTQLLGTNFDQFSIVNGGAPFTIEPGNSHAIDVKFVPTTIGTKNAALRIESNDPDEELFSVPLIGVGVVADISISPTFKNFGNVQVNQSGSQIFIVSNLGSSPLIVQAGGTTLVGGDASKFSITSGGAPFTLQPEQSREIVVSYNPDAESSDTTTFQIVSNDPDEDENPLNVTLTGRGVITDIDVDPAAPDFGSVALGDTALRMLTVTNLGTGDLAIPVSGTFFIGDDADEFAILDGGAPFNLAPNQDNVILVRFMPATTGEKNAFLRILSNDSQEPTLDVPITATGVAEPDIAVNTASLDFGSALLGTADTLAILVSNEGTADLIININGTTLLGENAEEFAIVSGGAPFTVAPSGEPQEIKVSFNPTTTGFKAAQLRIDSNDPDQDEEELFIELFGAGIGIPDISVAPGAKDFGEVFVGSSAQQIFSITNDGTDDLIIEVGDILLSGENPDQFALDGFSLPITLAPTESQNVTVIFSPTSEGEKSATLQISSNDPDEEENPVSVPLSGNGLVQPDIAVNPASKDYGSVLVGSSASQIFEISNEGSGDLVVGEGGVTLGGANADQFSIEEGGDAAFTIGPFATREITVSFDPGATGSKSAVLQIVSNDPDEGSKTVALSGVGNDPAEGAPGAPINLTSSPNTWTNAASIYLNWTNPEPKISGARYKIGSDPTSPVDGTLVSGNEITAIVKSTTAELLGIQTWYVWLVDSLGNSSHVNSSTVTTQFDNVAPATTSNAKTTFYNTDAVIQLSPSDAHSGLASTSYKINNGATQSGTEVTISTEGKNNTLEFWSTDVAGNEAAHTVVSGIKIDKTKPSALAGSPSTSGGNVFDVPFSANDNLSGVSYVELWYRLNGSSWLKSSGKFTTNPIAFTAPFGAGTYDFEIVAVDSAGNEEDRLGMAESSTLVTSIERRGETPTEFTLYQNYPNPFNPSTTIEFALPQPEKVRLLIYDVRGNLVRTLLDGVEKSMGYHQQAWDSRNDRGESVGSGAYFYRLEAGSYSKTTKMLLVK